MNRQLQGVGDVTHQLITNDNRVPTIYRVWGIPGKTEEVAQVIIFENVADPHNPTSCSFRFDGSSIPENNLPDAPILHHINYTDHWHTQLSSGDILNEQASTLFNVFYDTATLDITFEAYPIDPRLPSKFETTIYRICQESLNNISKHSGASKASLQQYNIANTLFNDT